MILKDASQNNLITSDAQEATTFLYRALGLINPKNSRFLILRTRFGIHTFFLKDAIDVLVLNKENQVVKIKKHLHPYCFFFYSPRFFLVVELPEGTIKRCRIHLNDKIFIG